jgi:hypothetical protein
MNDVSAVDGLTLGGIIDVPFEPGVNVILSQEDVGWMLTVNKLNNAGVEIEGAVVAELRNLPLLRNGDVITINTILLNSEDPDADLTVSGTVRPYDIADLAVNSISTGQGYFQINGQAELGREGVRVPGLPTTAMLIQYNGPKGNVTGKIMSSYIGLFETKGQVTFQLDPNTMNATKQHYANRKFVSTGVITVYEGNKHFKLNGILYLDSNEVRLHIIDKDLQIPGLTYVHADQSIYLGSKVLRVRKGQQLCSDNTWDYLDFDVNMKNFNGVDSTQAPMRFVVYGSVETSNAGIEVKNIDLGFAAIELKYDFEKEMLRGYMNFNPDPVPIVLGPVILSQIEAYIQVDKNGFLFSARTDGLIAGAFEAKVGLLIGSHTAIPTPLLTNVMKDAKFRELPESMQDGELNGFFITGHVELIDVEMPSVDLVFFGASGSAKVGFDAQVYMNFNQNGDASFGFGALAYAGAMVSAYVLLPPVPCPDPTICLSADLRLGLRAEIRKVSGAWEVSGTGCGSMLFSAAICGVSEDIGGRADITFISGQSPDVSITLDAACGDSNNDGSNTELNCNAE